MRFFFQGKVPHIGCGIVLTGLTALQNFQISLLSRADRSPVDVLLLSSLGIRDPNVLSYCSLVDDTTLSFIMLLLLSDS